MVFYSWHGPIWMERLISRIGEKKYYLPSILRWHVFESALIPYRDDLILLLTHGPTCHWLCYLNPLLDSSSRLRLNFTCRTNLASQPTEGIICLLAIPLPWQRHKHDNCMPSWTSVNAGQQYKVIIFIQVHSCYLSNFIFRSLHLND